MRTSTLLIGALIVTSLQVDPTPAKAWGKPAHLTICETAYRNLTPAARSAVVSLMRSNAGGVFVPARGRTEARTYTAFFVGCLEEDEIPRRNPNDHFINLSRDAQAIVGNVCPPNAADGECILAGIGRDLQTLGDSSRSREDRVFALMALGHWLGDIHQPLHVSFADDRGGNSIEARLAAGRCGTSRYRVENLHGVWDNCLPEAGLFEKVRQRADYRKTWKVTTVAHRAADTLMANTSVVDEQQIVEGEPWQWAQESFAVMRAPAVRYCIVAGVRCDYSASAAVYVRNAPKRRETIDQTYLAQFRGDAEKRIRVAGFRLAHLLNRALDPAYAGPVRDGLQPPSP